MLVSWEGRSRLSRTGWLKTIGIGFLVVLEARSLESRCWQCWLSLGASRENLSHNFLPAPCGLLSIPGALAG